MKYNHIVIHFGEIWLKGKNRGAFVKKLSENIKASLRGEDFERLENARDRFVLHLGKKSDMEGISNRLAHVFGISWFAPVAVCGSGKKEIIKTAGGMFKKTDHVRIEAHRSYKLLDYNSQELVGDFLRLGSKCGFVPDRDGPGELRISIAKDSAYLYRGKTAGPGGLPVGSSGKAVILLSGGIDSPVASVYAMKRGLAPIYVHMHAFPSNSAAVRSKMSKILEDLSLYSPRSKAYYLPSHPFQASILGMPHQLELVLFKRFLYKIAGKIADDEGAEVIVTGESLGQVASQTVKNLIATERGSRHLMMRPLIGFDKQEIIKRARELGTYDVSIQKYPDVCSLRARNPSTSADPDAIDKLYKKMKLDGVVKSTLKKAEVIVY